MLTICTGINTEEPAVLVALFLWKNIRPWCHRWSNRVYILPLKPHCPLKCITVSIVYISVTCMRVCLWQWSSGCEQHSFIPKCRRRSPPLDKDQCPHKRLAGHYAYRVQHVPVLPSAHDKSHNHAHKNANDLHNTAITNYNPPSHRQTR